MNDRLEYALYMRDQSHPGTLSFLLWNTEAARLQREQNSDPDYGGAFDGNTVTSDAEGGL